MSTLDIAIIDLLRPLVRDLVRDEFAREREQWRWRSVKQAATILDLSPKAIYHRVQNGQIPVRRIGSKLYVDMQALDHQLAS